MRLSEGIEIYVQRRRLDGFGFETGMKTLRSFCRHTGDIAVTQVTSLHVSSFLNRRPKATLTWRINYSLLRRFFEYLAARGVMPFFLMPPNRAPERPTFVGHIYSRDEIRALIRAIPESQSFPLCSLDKQVVRCGMLLLYGIGAKTGEIAGLQTRDIDLKRGYITISNVRPVCSRTIPIGQDLRVIVKSYLLFRLRKHPSHEHLFITRDGRPLTADMLRKCFQRLRLRAGLQVRSSSGGRPRMQDLRSSFAVHRIASWIRNRADLNRMLPALAAYMGLAGLTAAERYLALTPERFRKELMKLSPQRGRRHWRDDRRLMKFLVGL